MTKKIGIMQPYFFPYLGYWQLMNAVDEYVVYDNIQYTKKGWFNRNRFLQNGHDELFSINLVKDSDFLDVRERVISPVFDRKALTAKFANSYKKAPFFESVYPLIEEIISYENDNLFEYIFNSICKIHSVLGLRSKLIVSSTLDIDHNLKGAEKVKAIVLALNGTTYINPVGGIELYDKKNFEESGIELLFHKMKNITYSQFNNQFVPSLSIIDVMMFNSPETIREMLNDYELI